MNLPEQILNRSFGYLVIRSSGHPVTKRPDRQCDRTGKVPDRQSDRTGKVTGQAKRPGKKSDWTGTPGQIVSVGFGA